MILYPPHPFIKISFKELDKYEQTGKWIAQRKFNGTNLVIYVGRDRKIKLLTRHGTPPKLFSLSKKYEDQILSLDLKSGLDYWFNAELLDHKTTNKNYKGKIVLFDILHEGNYLLKMNQLDRINLLKQICKNSEELEENNKIAIKVSDDIWMAESWEKDFYYHYNEFLKLDEIEGLILRQKDSKIDNFGSKKYDVSWMIKCRKPHKGGIYEY